MATYENAYSILAEARESLKESSTALVQGSATYGKFSNDYILKKMNRAIRLIYGEVFRRFPQAFLTSTSLTGSSSVFTLPWDYGMIKRFETSDGYKIGQATVDDKPETGGIGTKYLYYRVGNTLVVTQSGISDTNTLWYYKKPREITMGAATASNTLATTAKILDDYYNGMIIENITTPAVNEITDYVGSTRVVTHAGTAVGSGEYYGLVSDMPEMFHHLFAPLTVMLCKAEHPVAPEKPTRAEAELFKVDKDNTLSAFGHAQGDITEEEIWTDFGTGTGYSGFNIPGQGYTIY